MDANGYSLVLVTPPSVSTPIVSHDIAKEHANLPNDVDGPISIWLDAATQFAQKYTGQQFVKATYKLGLERFPCGRHGGEIVIPLSPLSSVTSLTYLDGDGATQTLAAEKYTADTMNEPGRIVPAYGVSWPSARCRPNAVQVTFVAGYEQSLIPSEARQAVLMLVAHYSENREAALVGTISKEVEFAVIALLNPLRVGGYP